MKKFLLFCLLFTASCQNSYKKFFTKSSNSDTIVLYAGEPVVVYSNNFQKDVSSYQRKGYGFIGSSDLNSPGIGNSESQLKEFGKELGAEVILWNQSYSHTVSGNVPYTYYTPQTQTSYYSGNVRNTYAPLNSYNYNGSMTTYSQQQNTAYIPYSVPRFDYAAIFLGKLEKIRFGFLARELTDEERARYHLKSGVYVAIVITDSPAYDSELLEGDVVLKIDKRTIRDLDDFVLLDTSSIKKAKIEFLRDGKKKTTFITLSRNKS